MKKNEESPEVLVAGEAAAPANPPAPPGGGRWRWDGVQWHSTDPKPSVADVQALTQTVTE